MQHGLATGGEERWGLQALPVTSDQAIGVDALFKLGGREEGRMFEKGETEGGLAFTEEREKADTQHFGDKTGSPEFGHLDVWTHDMLHSFIDSFESTKLNSVAQN